MPGRLRPSDPCNPTDLRLFAAGVVSEKLTPPKVGSQMVWCGAGSAHGLRLNIRLGLKCTPS